MSDVIKCLGCGGDLKLPRQPDKIVDDDYVRAPCACGTLTVAFCDEGGPLTVVMDAGEWDAEDPFVQVADRVVRYMLHKARQDSEARNYGREECAPRASTLNREANLCEAMGDWLSAYEERARAWVCAEYAIGEMAGPL